LKKFLIIILLLTIGAVFFTSKIFSLSSQRTEVISLIEKKLDAKVTIRGEVSAKFFPSLGVNISHLRVTRNSSNGEEQFSLRAPETHIGFSLAALLRGGFQINDIRVSDAKFKVLIDDNAEFSKFLAGDAVKKFKVSRSDIRFIDHTYGIEKAFTNVNLNMSQNRESAKFSGDFASEDNSYTIDSRINKIKDAAPQTTIDIASGYNKFNFTGNVANKSSISGKVKFSGEDFRLFIFDYIKRDAAIFPDSTDISKFNIEADLLLTDKRFELKSGVIKSDALNGKFDVLSQKHKDIHDVNITTNFDQIDLDLILTREHESVIKQKMLKFKNQKTSPFQFDLANDVVINFRMTADKLMRNHKEIRNLLIAGRVKEQQIDFSEVAAVLTDDSTLSAKAIYSLDQKKWQGGVYLLGSDFAKFLANFDIEVPPFADERAFKKFAFKALFNQAEGKLNIRDITMNLDNIRLYGKIDYDKNTAIKLNSDLTINAVNFDQYYINLLDQQPTHLLAYYYSAMANHQVTNTVLRKLSDLRSDKVSMSLKFKVNEFLYNQQKYKNLSTKLTINNSIVALDEFKINDKDNNFSLMIHSDIDKPRPEVIVELNGDILDSKFLFHVTDDKGQGIWSADDFKILPLQGLDVFIKANIKKILYKNVILRNNLISMKIIEEKLDIKEFRGNISKNGGYEIKGSMLLEGLPSLDVDFSLNKVELADILSSLFAVNNISGLGNINGKIETHGHSPLMFIRQMQATVRFLGRNVVINNLAITKTTEAIAGLYKNPDTAINQPLNEFIRNGKTVFKDLSGDIRVNRGDVAFRNIKLVGTNVSANTVGRADLTNMNISLSSAFAFKAFYKSGKKISTSNLRFNTQTKGVIGQTKTTMNLKQVDSFVKTLQEAYTKRNNRAN
jgi:hypothetical protein